MERITRRELLKKGSVVGAGLAIGSSVGRRASAAEKGQKTPLPKIVERNREGREQGNKIQSFFAKNRVFTP